MAKCPYCDNEKDNALVDIIRKTLDGQQITIHRIKCRRCGHEWEEQRS